MGYEQRLALERIVKLCAGSRQPTKRTERIYDIALAGLGFTANQREFEITKMRQGAIQRSRDDLIKRKRSITGD
jgi:hypothetical protein